MVIKQVRGDLAARPETAPLLRAEAEVVQRLAHGNIVQVLDFGVDDGAPYLVMEHVDGVTLADRDADVQSRAGLDVAAALFVVESVCGALDHAHRVLGVVHRDVTPSNILVSRDGVVKLTDFGIASLIATAGVVGTPGFAAPEQAAGSPVDPRADVYALGVVLGRLLARWPGGDAALAEVAARATAAARDERWASAQAFAAALETWRAARGVLRDATALADAVRSLQRRRGQVAGSVGAALEQRQRPAMTAVLVDRPRRGARVWGPVAAAAVVVGVGWFGSTPAEVTALELRSSERIEQAAPIPVPVVPTRTPYVAEAPARATGPRRPDEPDGRLLVNLVPWAQVRVDGRDLGRTPINVTLAPGRYTLTLANPDLGQRRTRQIAIAGRTDTSITDW